MWRTNNRKAYKAFQVNDIFNDIFLCNLACLLKGWIAYFKVILLKFQLQNKLPNQDGATSHTPIGLSKKVSTSTELKEFVFQEDAELPSHTPFQGTCCKFYPKQHFLLLQLKWFGFVVFPRRYMGLSFSWHFSPPTSILPCLLKLHVLWWSTSPAQSIVNFGAITEGLVIIKDISNKNNISMTGNWSLWKGRCSNLHRARSRNPSGYYEGLIYSSNKNRKLRTLQYFTFDTRISLHCNLPKTNDPPWKRINPVRNQTKAFSWVSY